VVVLAASKQLMAVVDGMAVVVEQVVLELVLLFL
jgi:hypothetical protein